MQLTKSDYMLYLKHPAWLWYKKHDPRVLPLPDPAKASGAHNGAVFETYAEQRFPDGLRLGFENFDDYSELTQATRGALDEDVQTIFQGRFDADRLTCIVDVLDRVDGKTYDLYEIKASTSVEARHIVDLAFQTFVLEESGVPINGISVILVDNSYVKHGELDVEGFTRVDDVTDRVRSKMEWTRAQITDAVDVLDMQVPPDISPRHVRNGAMKDWLPIYRSIRGNLPDYSIHDLCGASAKTLGALEDRGIQLMTNIPDDYHLTGKQAAQVQAVKTNRRHVDIHHIAQFLDALDFPLYFLDYETFGSMVPAFDGLRPYEQVPFQYSLHSIDRPGGEVRHKEYLHTDTSHPAEPLVRQLMQDIGPVGTVVTWNQSFEKMCNRGLGRWVPEAQGFMEELNERIVDLIVPFKSGWFVDKDFCGSASIKKVLPVLVPVLVPELSYTDMAIHEGSAAQRLWTEAVILDSPHIDKEKLFYDLMQYCGLDTLAMVKIYEYLAQHCSHPEELETEVMNTTVDDSAVIM